MTTQMLISLVAATKDRTVELARLLESLARQTYTKFEVLVVDQNPDDRLKPILDSWSGRNLTRLVSEAGLSRARNVGLSAANGEVLAFPDDDCWYGPELLDSVARQFRAHAEWNGLCGRTMGDQGGSPLWQWHTQAGPVTKRNIWRRVNSNSIFLRRSLFQEGLRFDERLGAGAGTPWGSAEEVDLILTALGAGVRIEFVPEIVVYHKNVFPDGDPAEITRAYRYACGTGFVLRKHRYPLDALVLRLLAPAAYATGALITGNLYRARFMAAIARGRIRGLVGAG